MDITVALTAKGLKTRFRVKTSTKYYDSLGLAGFGGKTLSSIFFPGLLLTTSCQMYIQENNSPSQLKCIQSISQRPPGVETINNLTCVKNTVDQNPPPIFVKSMLS